MSDTSTRQPKEHGRYEIRIEGHLDGRWAAWFDGLSVTNESDGITVIHGYMADQAALYGVLLKLHDLGLALVSVAQGGPGQSTVSTSKPR
jgi:hypothetical protein